MAFACSAVSDMSYQVLIKLPVHVTSGTR